MSQGMCSIESTLASHLLCRTCSIYTPQRTVTTTGYRSLYVVILARHAYHFSPVIGHIEAYPCFGSEMQIKASRRRGFGEGVESVGGNGPRLAAAPNAKVWMIVCVEK